MDQLALLKDQTAKTRQCRRKSPKPTPSSAKSRRITKAGKKAGKNLVSGDGWRFYCKSSENMEEIDSDSVALTITSPLIGTPSTTTCTPTKETTFGIANALMTNAGRLTSNGSCK